MRNLSFIFLLFCSVQVFAQTKGITYQAVIYNPSDGSLPGVDSVNAPMANKSVCLQFSILDASSQIEYQELISITTDEFGMVNLVIGNGLQTNGYATSFSKIAWSVDQKSLKVALDIAGQCFDFVVISTQKFEAAPYAFSTNTADNLSGILPIENGGTNASTVLGAKTNLGLEKVDNTSDLNKTISIATQSALDLKENTANKSTDFTLADGTNTKFPTELAVKTFVTGEINSSNTANTAAIAVVQADVDANEITSITADATLQNNINTLSSTVTTNATTAANATALKENATNKSTDVTLADGTNTKFPTELAVKTFVTGEINTSNTTNTQAIATVQADVDANEITSNTSDATLQNNINTLSSTVISNATTAANATALKENTSNKSTDVTLADGTNTKFPTELAVKTFVTGQITTSNTANTAAIAAVQADVDANETAANAAISLKENTANKSTTTTLGTSDVLYPTQNAVKTYVDAQVASAAISIGAIGGSSNANGASLTSGVLRFSPADETNGGIVTTLPQIFAGAKTFTTDLRVNGITVGKGKGNIDNTAIGLEALNASGNSVTGTGNTAIGKVALTKNTIGTANVAVGQGSLFANLEGGSNTAIGYDALRLNVGSANTAVGRDALKGSISGSSNNTAIGYQALRSCSNSTTGYLTGTYNTTVGSGAGYSISTGSYNIIVGGQDQVSTGFYNTLIGYNAQVTNGSMSNATAIGFNAKAAANATSNGNYAFALASNSTAIGNGSYASASNATAIGNGARAEASNATAIGNGAVVAIDNTIQLGADGSDNTTAVTNVNTSGTISAGTVTYPNIHNSISGQILTINNTGIASWAAGASITELSDEFTATDAQTSFTITHSKGTNRTIKMYINGIRISNTAYSDSSTTVTYNSISNGGYTIVAGDRIQFDYSY